METKKIRVKMYNAEMPKFKKLTIGDWTDVRVNAIGISANNKEDIEYMQDNKIIELWQNKKITYNKGDVVLCRLGFAMELPSNYEAELRPRSGTFKNYGLVLTNSVGTIDESYKGNDDEWMMMFYATRDGEIELFDRVGQFRINEKMPPIEFEYVADLGNENRGGYNSTGLK